MKNIFGIILTSGLLMTNAWADMNCPADSAIHIDVRTMLPDGTPNPTYGQEIATGICGCLEFVNGVTTTDNTVTFTVNIVDNESIRGIELDVIHNAGDALHFGPEPYEDANGNGNYDAGESYTDLDGDGSWSSNAFGSGVTKGSKLLEVTDEDGVQRTMTLLSNQLDGFVKVLAYNTSRASTAGDGVEGNLFNITYGLPNGVGSLPGEISFYFSTANLPGTSMDPDILNVVCGYPDESNPNVVNTSNVSADLGDVVPDKFALKQNYPNPFNPSTQISFDVPAGSDQVMINIYNILGQNVNTLVSGVMTPGTYTVDWNATDMMGNSVASGIYFYELRSKSFTARKKMLLIR
jgi:hypothetical protein